MDFHFSRRFSKDPYDRYWWGYASSSWKNLSTQNTITQLDKDSFAVPSSLLQTAITIAGNGTVLNVALFEPSNPSLLFRVFLHFADFQNTQLRQFNIYVNDQSLDNYSPEYLTALRETEKAPTARSCADGQTSGAVGTEPPSGWRQVWPSAPDGRRHRKEATEGHRRYRREDTDGHRRHMFHRRYSHVSRGPHYFSVTAANT